MTDLARTQTDAAGAHQRRTPALVGAVWALLVINTLGSQGAVTVIPIPRPVAQMITMGAMLGALALALLLNPRLRFRPSAFLLLMTVLLAVSIASSVRLESGYGALFRCFRLSCFIATLWLLSAFWDEALVFVRHHIRVLGAVLVTVALGLLVAPGLAFSDVYSGRLVGVVWPLTPPQIGLYAATVVGLTLLLWLGKRTDKWSALAVSRTGVHLNLDDDARLVGNDRHTTHRGGHHTKRSSLVNLRRVVRLPALPVLCLIIARLRYAPLIFVVVGCGLATVWDELISNQLIRVMAGFLVGLDTYQLVRHCPKLARIPALGTVVVVLIILWATLGGPPWVEIGILLFAALILALTSDRDWSGECSRGERWSIWARFPTRSAWCTGSLASPSGARPRRPAYSGPSHQDSWWPSTSL